MAYIHIHAYHMHVHVLQYLFLSRGFECSKFRSQVLNEARLHLPDDTPIEDHWEEGCGVGWSGTAKRRHPQGRQEAW